MDLKEKWERDCGKWRINRRYMWKQRILEKKRKDAGRKEWPGQTEGCEKREKSDCIIG